MLVDSHCHLDYPEFAEEFPDVLARAGEAGVGYMVTICTKVSEFSAVQAIAEAHDNIFCSVGVHPHDAADEGGVSTAELVRLAGGNKVVGIGETGLDFYYENSPRPAQAENFRSHIAAARETQLPLIVHTRDADGETVEILRDEMEKGAFPGLIHCFSVGKDVAACALELGLYISLSGIVTFKNAVELREIAKELPLDRVLVETDAPFLAPIPNRGKRNEPAFVVHTAACVAEIMGVAPDALADATTDNFFRLFDKAAQYANR